VTSRQECEKPQQDHSDDQLNKDEGEGQFEIAKYPLVAGNLSAAALAYASKEWCTHVMTMISATAV
jgi:hypothetical protein